MKDEERLKLILEMKSRLYSIYDTIEKESCENRIQIQQKLEEIMIGLNHIVDDYTKNTPYFFNIISEENVIISNGKKVEIKTNITGVKINADELDTVFKGNIPDCGYLKLFADFTEDGLKFYAKSVVSEEFYDEDDYSTFHQQGLTTRGYLSPGAHLIFKGQAIGVGIKHYTKSNRVQYIEDEISQWPDWKRVQSKDKFDNPIDPLNKKLEYYNKK